MKQKIDAVLIVIFSLLAVALILGLPVMLLWNWLMPIIFGIKYITFWQAVGVNILCSILFKSNGTSNNNNK